MPDDKNPSWKGESVGYHGIHKWVTRKLGKPQKCTHCGTEEASKYEWASVGHTYSRDLTQWLRLCTSCHRKLDYNHKKKSKEPCLKTVKGTEKAT